MLVPKGVSFKDDTGEEPFNFKKAVDLHGYVKARQMLKQETIRQHQKVVDKQDIRHVDSMQPRRMIESIRQSKTLGNQPTISYVHKVLDICQEKNVRASDGSNAEAIEVATKRSLISTDQSLLLPQINLEALPSSMGDTLFMQTGYLRSIGVPGNKLSLVVGNKLPQLNMNNLRYIQHFNLSNNRLKSLSSDFGKCRLLVDINLSYNELSSLPPSFCNLRNLKKCNLAHNNMSDLENDFYRLKELTELNLAGNLFSHIPYAITRLASLRKLDMSKNVLFHMAIQSPFMKQEDMWYPVVDHKNGRKYYKNVLTKEKVARIDEYDGRGFAREAALNVFQRANTKVC
jgi:hypothetical protein